MSQDIADTVQFLGSAPRLATSIEMPDGSVKAVSAAQPMPITLITDDKPTLVNSVSGNGGAPLAIGSLGGSANNVLGYGTPFVPAGENITIYLDYYYNGDHAINYGGGGGQFWLEQDISGTGKFPYTPVTGTVVPFNTIALPEGGNNIVLTFNVRPFGSWRLVGNIGALTGSTGVVGWNLWLLN